RLARAIDHRGIRVRAQGLAPRQPPDTIATNAPDNDDTVGASRRLARTIAAPTTAGHNRGEPAGQRRHGRGEPPARPYNRRPDNRRTAENNRGKRAGQRRRGRGEPPARPYNQPSWGYGYGRKALRLNRRRTAENNRDERAGRRRHGRGEPPARPCNRPWRENRYGRKALRPR